MSAIKQLHRYGQSPWLDYIQRGLVTGGALQRLIADDGITGVTSNPAIFEKAIAGAEEYREGVRALRREGLSPQQIYERLAIEDVQAAADALRPVYETTARRDGYVSLEVSPNLARDTARTVEEARRLWRAAARPNLMIKVPGTPQGMPAVQALISEGINVNVTLLFSLQAYRAAAQAYLAGIEHRASEGRDASAVASVASFFVSRIDTVVDAALERALASKVRGERARLEPLRGKAAIANAKLAFRLFRAASCEPRWQRLAHMGAMPQRLLWASTGTKNPAYRDVLYVEELIGPDTVNTMPTATIDAFRDHGEVRPSLEEDIEAAQEVMAGLAAAGIAFGQVTEALLDEGIRLFAAAFDSLLAAVEQSRSGA